ncbi:MFS transporter [Comamonas aquatica]|jgi:predicted MFS family arabinose efflux permease|uniref:MFS transporter n=1 Tax=Comamonas aquatica TaxID=225991 RepID=UPI001B38649A|nr:MFS transporter [Comamonas aquatica]MDH0494157.1 MFS transporter [Comamonas aquatica]MDH1673605.1 MFS transporter [Comamonas aquatica]MDH1678143.1 MFS transporter [Comamonas aquatica]MDH1766836.1 MFS transporter [Comamonas aquatica]MDH1814650.1 MFS transporter [Comamonas aquatica]
MLLALLSGFALSQAFRTITAILAQGLQQDFGISASSLGAFAGLFGLSFGVAQLLMGIGMDLYGLRRTVLTAFPLAALGAGVSAAAPSYGWLMLGQLLIGVGCSPAFLACTIFIARHFPADRFAFFSGLSMGVGGLGLLFTGTPLAWVVELGGWRSGFWLLCGLCVASWLLIFAMVHEPRLPQAPSTDKESWGQAFVRLAELLTLPHTWGMLVLGMSCYAAFLSLRGLWLGPLLMDRHSFSLVSSGHVAFGVSLISLFTPAMFGRLDPGTLRRRTWLGWLSLLMAALFVTLALWHHPLANVLTLVAMALLSGYSLLQYADVRASYPNHMTGRALSLFTMSMFLGVALMQWFTGVVAAWATRQGWEAYTAVALTIALWLACASTAYRLLPASPLLKATAA